MLHSHWNMEHANYQAFQKWSTLTELTAVHNVNTLISDSASDFAQDVEIDLSMQEERENIDPREFKKQKHVSNDGLKSNPVISDWITKMPKTKGCSNAIDWLANISDQTERANVVQWLQCIPPLHHLPEHMTWLMDVDEEEMFAK